MKLNGLHHITAITADINANLEFYGQLLGASRRDWASADGRSGSIDYIRRNSPSGCSLTTRTMSSGEIDREVGSREQNLLCRGIGTHPESECPI